MTTVGGRWSKFILSMLQKKELDSHVGRLCLQHYHQNWELLGP